VAHHFATQFPVSVAQYLADHDFPASKQEVVWSAQLRDAQDDVLRLLRRIPNQQYTDLAHVMSNLSRAGVKRLASGRVFEWRGSR
jgi:hypothetical protein